MAKSVFSKRGAVLRPMKSTQSIIRATAMRLKPIYTDIIDEVISKTINYAKAQESLRVKEADFSKPNIKKIVDDHAEDIEAVLLPNATNAARFTVNSVLSAFASKYSAEFFNKSVRPVIANRIFKIVTTDITASIEQSLKEKFNTAIQDGWSLDKLEKNLTELKGNYATIARTEILSASSQAERIQTSHEIAQLGVAARTIKEWHISGSGKERDSHIDASIKYGPGSGIPYADDFIINRPTGGTEAAFAPMDARLSAGNFINCQCHMVVRVMPLEI